MRAVEILQVSSTIVGAAFTVLATVEQRLVKRLRREGAASPEGAVRLGPLRPPTRWVLKRLRERGAVGVVEPGAVFLDEELLRNLKRRRARVAAVAIPTAILVVFVLYLLD